MDYVVSYNFRPTLGLDSESFDKACAMRFMYVPVRALAPFLDSLSQAAG